jgi:hypothetical protein
MIQLPGSVPTASLINGRVDAIGGRANSILNSQTQFASLEYPRE